MKIFNAQRDVSFEGLVNEACELAPDVVNFGMGLSNSKAVNALTVTCAAIVLTKKGGYVEKDEFIEAVGLLWENLTSNFSAEH